MSNVYDFGGPVDYLQDIHFPSRRGKKDPYRSEPWFWYLSFQPVTFFQYLSPRYWGRGWQCAEFLPVIKILPIDTQPIVPTTPVGFNSIEEAIDRTNAGEPISQDAWGRFGFGRANKWFWKVIGKDQPQYQNIKGVPTQPKKGIVGLPVATQIKTAVELWRDDWNTGAIAFDQATRGVSGDGQYSVIPPNNGFAVSGVPPGATIPQLQENLGKTWYFGALPFTSFFISGSARIFKQTWAARMSVAQLDPHEWDFSQFPPKRTSLLQIDGGSGNPPFSATLNASAYNPDPSTPDFPQNSPIIISAG